MAINGADAIPHPPSRRPLDGPRRWGRACEAARTVRPIEEKEHQLVLTLVAQLAAAQFIRADQASTARLWQEVAALAIDPERVIRLLYGGQDLNDRANLADMDRCWQQDVPRGRRFPWDRPAVRRGASAAGRRSVPRAELPARR